MVQVWFSLLLNFLSFFSDMAPTFLVTLTQGVGPVIVFVVSGFLYGVKRSL